MKHPLADLPNLGDKTAHWLQSAGISNELELRQLGTIDTCRKLILNGQDINLLAAYAIAGAIHNHHWNRLPIELKQETRHNFRALQQELGLK